MRSKIANNKRLQPDYFAFDKQAGLKLIEEYKHSESEFADIYAKFIGVFSVLREQLNATGLSSQNCQEVVKSAISHCLIEGQKVFNNLRLIRYQAYLPPTPSSADIYNMRTIEGGDGQAYSGDELSRAIFETLKTILDYCAYLQNEPSIGGADGGQLCDITKLMRIFNLFEIYKGDWQDFLWLNNAPNISGEELSQNPVQIAWAIGLSREFSLNFQSLLAGNIISRKAAANHRFLDGRIASTRKVKRDFGKFRNSMMNYIVYPFLLDILEREKHAGTVVARVVDLYLLLIFISMGNIRKLSPAPPIEAFVFAALPFEEFLQSQLSVDRSALLEAIEWLKFKPNQREDIWFTPLCLIEEHYVLLSPMIAEANFERFAEYVVARAGGLEIGKLFENYVIERTRAAVANPDFPKIAVLGPRLFQGKYGAEEIDLLLIIGYDVFLAEIKYDAFTADEISIYQHIDKLRRACQQARRKSEFLESNWPNIVANINLADGAYQFFPFCITEKPFLSGFRFADVPILALRDFEDFFAGTMHFNAVIEGKSVSSIGKTIKTFESTASLGSDFRRYMMNCPRTEEFARRLRITESLSKANEIVLSEYTRVGFEVG